MADFANDPDSHRYLALVDGKRVGFAHYRIEGDSVVFDHTVVDPAARGGGVASGLVKFALDDVREGSERRVVAECSYVVSWLERHPEYQDLTSR